MKLKALALAAVAGLSLSSPARSDDDMGRYKVSHGGDFTILLDSKTGTTWRLVWTNSQSPGCEAKAKITPPECRLWVWQLLPINSQMPK